MGRLRPERLLDHDIRRRMLDLVAEKPGIHLAEITRQLGVGGGTANYHLGVLKKAGYVRVERHGIRACVYTNGRLHDKKAK